MPELPEVDLTEAVDLAAKAWLKVAMPNRLWDSLSPSQQLNVRQSILPIILAVVEPITRQAIQAYSSGPEWTEDRPSWLDG